MRPFFLSTAALACAFAVGCADQPTPVEPADIPQTSVRMEQNSEGSGAIVVRDQQGAVFGIDPDAGLSALIGWTFAELEQWCATGSFPTRLVELGVFRPQTTEEVIDLKYLLRGTQVPVLVWEVANGDLCGELLLLPHLTGTGNYILTDNDRFTTGSRGNAAHEGFQGQVTAETGERFKFSEKFHIVILPSGEIRSFTFEFELKAIGA